MVTNDNHPPREIKWVLHNKIGFITSLKETIQVKVLVSMFLFKDLCKRNITKGSDINFPTFRLTCKCIPKMAVFFAQHIFLRNKDIFPTKLNQKYRILIKLAQLWGLGC